MAGSPAVPPGTWSGMELVEIFEPANAFAFKPNRSGSKSSGSNFKTGEWSGALATGSAVFGASPAGATAVESEDAVTLAELLERMFSVIFFGGGCERRSCWLVVGGSGVVVCAVASPANASAALLPFMCTSFFKRSTACGSLGLEFGWAAGGTAGEGAGVGDSTFVIAAVGELGAFASRPAGHNAQANPTRKRAAAPVAV